MSIENISKAYLNNKIANIGRFDSGKVNPKAGKKDSKESPKGSDTVDISGEARNIGEVLANLKSGLNKVPDQRISKMKEIESKLKENFYDSREVIEGVAENISDVFNARK
jgi:hypothetical protein